MFKLVLALSAVLAVAFAAPAPGVLAAYTAPVVTATSSQVVARNYNGLVVAAPAVAPVVAPARLAVSPYSALPYSALPYSAVPALGAYHAAPAYYF